MMLMTLLVSLAAQAAPMDYPTAQKAFNSAPAVVSARSIAATWTLIALTTPDTRLATGPNGDYTGDDGVVVHDTHVIDLSLDVEYNSIESASGRVRVSYLFKGMLQGGSLVVDMPNSGCHQVDSCRVLKSSGHLLCATNFVDTSDECRDAAGTKPAMFIELQK